MREGLSGTHPLSDALGLAQSAGFEGLELCIGTEGVLTPATSQSDCEAIRRRIESSGLVVETLASGMSWALSPTSDDSQVRDRSIELHLGAIERAAWLGCEAVLFVPGVVNSPIAPHENIRNDIAIQRANVAVSRLLEAAEASEIDLCLENVWNGMFTSPLEMATFVDSFATERLGVYFDVGNVLRYHQHPPHWIELLSHRIKRVHVKDFVERFDWNGDYAFCDLGCGDVPWQATMEALKKIGYDSTLVAEVLPYKEGILEQTSMAMDRIISLTNDALQVVSRRFDTESNETVGLASRSAKPSSLDKKL
ncbi:Xylose isomerase-like TIM barrel [Bythopirellula goksoeyrii]|uniref:Xylose isomerase-like TIM barrel n=2 Tax=Bythopirellula goksoeyrii TaxID=1400387 RepID=A0A5B9Q5X0_9BACT|nr:Xylose isomerase-like TIM barrel [Bythopirellula goksoeyrii]